MPEARKYTGGCHCGKVRYEVTSALTPAIACNCSMCGKKASILTFVPETQFKLLSGEDNLTDYQFNKHLIHHVFCKTCGLHSFARGVAPDGTKTAAINIRCLDDVDVSTLEVTNFDGKSR
jgi:hypothetical protein